MLRAIRTTTLSKVPRLAAYINTKTEKKPCMRFRVKQVPKDIWAEANDPRYTGTELVEGKWQYVERLLAQIRIPTPPKKSSSTGWRLPKEEAVEGPYYILRNRNHMLPVYENFTKLKKDSVEENVLVTRVNKIHGDIYLFEADAKAYLESLGKEKVESHVNEVALRVDFRGHHMVEIKQWLYERGF